MCQGCAPPNHFQALIVPINYSGQPYSAYAVHLTTLSPPAFIGDGALVWLLYKAGQTWSADQRHLALYTLFVWMFISKFSKNLGHYIRYPTDVALLPVSILFGWFHGLIKLYAMVTLDVVSVPCITPGPLINTCPILNNTKATHMPLFHCFHMAELSISSPAHVITTTHHTWSFVFFYYLSLITLLDNMGQPSRSRHKL